MPRPTDLPWERPSIIAGDMFGSLDEGPLIRRARELAHDRAQAEATYEARAANLRPWETARSVAEEVLTPFNVTQPVNRRSDVRSVGGDLYERDEITGEWGLVASAPKRPQQLTALERNTALYNAQLKAAEDADTPEEKAHHLEQANATKAWVEKQGKFAPPPPPKPPSQTITESVRQILNPAFRDDTNAPPMLSLTNQSSRITSPFTNNPFALGFDSVMSTNAPAASSTGLREGQRVRNKRTGKMGTVRNGVVVPD